MSRSSLFIRTLDLDLEGNSAAFLWGARKVGKTTLLRQRFPDARTYDLLDTTLKTRLMLRPAILREEVLAARPPLVVVDEVQKVPALLDEVHWCLENTSTRFLLCGSSARSLRRSAANLLGGRAWRFELFPLTTAEIPDLELDRALNHGLIPSHYLTTRPDRSLEGYLYDYIEQEIQAEAALRNIPAFARFLEAAAHTNGQLLNYANVARDCGVSAKTVRAYYQILEDTLLGYTLPPYRGRSGRRLIQTAKFYLLDPGVARALRGFHTLQPGSAEYGHAFEHFLVGEIRAYLAYRERRLPIAFWRTSTGLEVDLLIGEGDLAVEFKASARVDARHSRGLRALMEEHPMKRAVIVSLDETHRQLASGIEVMPWRHFCDALWSDQLLPR